MKKIIPYDDIIQICNITPPRRGFDNPQEGRVYSIEGIAPCIRNDSRFNIVEYEEENNIK